MLWAVRLAAAVGVEERCRGERTDRVRPCCPRGGAVPDPSDLSKPVAARLQRPSWRDTRLLVGVVLVLVSVVAGAKVVAAADDTVPVYAATRTLVPGHRLVEGDVRRVAVRTDDLRPYADGTRPLSGDTYVLREVRPGELLPRSALGGREQVSVKAVSLPVDASAVHGLVVGSVVDVWVSERVDDAARETWTEPHRALRSVTVARMPAASTGLGVGATDTAVQVLVPDDAVEQMIAAVDAGSRVTLVPVPGSLVREAS